MMSANSQNSAAPAKDSHKADKKSDKPDASNKDAKPKGKSWNENRRRDRATDRKSDAKEETTKKSELNKDKKENDSKQSIDRRDGKGDRRDGRKDSGGHGDSAQRSDRNGKGSSQKDPSSELMTMLQKPKSKDKGLARGSKDGRKNDDKKAVSALEAQWQKEEAEKRKKEAEEKRKKEEEEKKIREEEEKIRAEEEKKRQEEEDAKRKIEEEKTQLHDFLRDTKEKLEIKQALREANLKAPENRPDESFFSRLDSSLKKNTAFVKKVRNLTEAQKDSLSRDFNGLNLSKYVGEVASAITEAKLKMSDINCALHICSLMHQRYVEFHIMLLESWQKVLPNKKDEKSFNASKLRVDLRFFADLVAVAVFTEKVGLPMLASQLTMLISNDKEEHNNLSILLSFSRHCGDDYAGLVPQRIKQLAEKYEAGTIPQSKLLPPERQKACRNLLKEYYNSLTQHFLSDYKKLKEMDKHNRKLLHTRGELSQERKDQYEATQQAFTKLQSNTNTFADLLNETLPDLPEISTKDELGVDMYNPESEFQYEGENALFEDEDTRMFYENLPDLKAMVPGILYKDSIIPENKEEAKEEETTEEEMNIEDVERDLAAGMGDIAKDDKKEENLLAEVQAAEEDTELDMGNTMKMMMEAFIQNLPNSVNREMIDRVASDFCMNLNTKPNRKKLIRALFTVQRTRYDLLPFYSRLVATLNPIMPDVGTDLCTLLKGDFKWHVRKKDPINIESKIKTVRFIGEMVKFRIFPKNDVLHLLKMLMFDFRHHHIDMACALLESCGRFLYRSPDSHHRTRVYLDVMMRKKSALQLEARYNTLIENAYYYSNPPEYKQETKVVRPPMHEYIRKLLYKDLSKVTVEKVLRQIRKLNWEDADTRAYGIKCLTGVWHVRYNSIHCCANLLAGLAPYHEEVAIQVVDGILEDLRIGMEVNHPKFNQRRVSTVKFLGELYNYRMVESAVIFKTLYSFISFGVSIDPNLISPYDPPEHLFRIRLVCVLLDTCGHYFDRGTSKKKLDCFIVYFQRYYWYKRSLDVWSTDRPFPVEVEYMVQDTLESVRPKQPQCKNLEEALAQADELDKEFRAKLAELLPIEETGEEEEGLAMIQEADETDEGGLSLSQVRFTSDGHTNEDEEHSMMGSDMEEEDMSGKTPQSRSRSHSQTPGEGEDSYEEDIEYSGEEMGGEEVVLKERPRLIKCNEDDDFMAAFDKMMIDNIQARSQESVKVPQVDISVPTHLQAQGREKALMVASAPKEDQKEASQEVHFTLLTKRGNKAQGTDIVIPMDLEFANKFRERKEMEREEKEKMKRLVLDMNERQEEEAYQAEMLAAMNRPAPANMNRERRVRYQHPKGAPDADLIFGSKKR